MVRECHRHMVFEILNFVFVYPKINFMSRVTVVILVVVVSLFYFSSVGCRARQSENQVNREISELVKKEEELKSIGVPSFITQEQAKIREGDGDLVISMSQVTDGESLQKDVQLDVENQNRKVTQESYALGEVKPLVESIPVEVKTQESSIKKVHKLEVESRKEKVSEAKVEGIRRSLEYQTRSYTKVYFSYRNGFNYVSKTKPCKITTVLFASKDVWYVDYNVYAVPLSKSKVYNKYLVEKYLIGIGRNISVVEGRSQLTVYWTGVNIRKELLPRGKYIIVSSTHLKDKNKKFIGKIVKVLGVEKPLVVVLK